MTDQPDWVFDHQIRQWVREDGEPAPRPRRLLSEPEYLTPVLRPGGFTNLAVSRDGDLISMNPDPIQMHQNDLMMRMMREVDGKILSDSELFIEQRHNLDLLSADGPVKPKPYRVGAKERRFRRRLAARRA